MESSAVFIRTFFILIISVCNVVGEIRKVSAEEDMEFERQLKTLNKPAIKTIKTKYGDIFDCVDIYKQPAFDNPLLKNHKLKMRPSMLPKKPQQEDPSMTPNLKIVLPEGGCPEGYVPIRRTQKADLVNAQMFLNNNMGPILSTSNTSTNTYISQVQWRGKDKVYGTRFNLNLWGLQVDREQYSTANTWIEHGCEMINAGWMADPLIFGDTRSRLFVHWTTGCQSKIGCFNTLCPGFVQIDGQVAVGNVLEPVSDYQGRQYEVSLHIFMDSTTSDGNWWLVIGENKPVGYWPSKLFTNLSSYADVVAWGGCAKSPSGRVKPPIGSSHCPLEGFRRACYFRKIQLMDMYGSFYDPLRKDLPMYSSPCYGALGRIEEDEVWRFYVYFGGPAGCPCENS